MNMKLTALGFGLVALAACDSAVAPTQGQSDLNAATATYNSLRTRATTSLDPAGAGTYRGKFGSSNVTIDGEGGYGMVGDIAMNIEFASSSNNVNGALSDINLIDRLAAEGSQVMTNGAGTRTPGTLNITGTEVGGSIAATATGQLGAVLANSLNEATAQMNVQLNGRVRSNSALGDTVTGTLSGSGTGAAFANTMDVNIPSGFFYGSE